ncbi:hypothetical protein QTP70_019402, partial [Hemibagrus guttatus]
PQLSHALDPLQFAYKQKVAVDNAILHLVHQTLSHLDKGKGAASSVTCLHRGSDVERVRSYRYLGLQLDDNLDWSVSTDYLYKKGQSRLFFLRRLGSFNI